MYLVVEDAVSEWPEVIMTKSTTSVKTVEILRTIFARNDLPEQLISDNGPQFVSEEFKEFVPQNRIRHTTGASYHPSTNQLVERFVHTFKQVLCFMRDGELIKLVRSSKHTRLLLN